MFLTPCSTLPGLKGVCPSVEAASGMDVMFLLVTEGGGEAGSWCGEEELV